MISLQHQQDLTNAYQQMILDEHSRNLVTINTHKGLYRYTKLPFGVASAPAIFQKTVYMVLQGLPSVIYYLDDLLIAGHTERERVCSQPETSGAMLKAV